MGMHTYSPRDGHGLAHDPTNAIIGPRPIGWIGTRSEAGVMNLAPYSFFNLFNYRPPIIGFSSIGKKDSVRNAEATGVFTWNLATRELAERMNETSASVPPETDEFPLGGLTAKMGEAVAAPFVAEAPVHFEAKVTQIITLKTATGDATDTHMVFGEVVRVAIDEALIEDGVYQTAKARPILRAGGPAAYAEITPMAMFEMTRPDAR